MKIRIERDVPGLNKGDVILPDTKEITGVWVTDNNGDPQFLVKGDYELIDGSSPGALQ